MSKSYSPAWRLFTVIVFRPLLHVLVRNKWEGQENIPKSGPVIIAPNHMSYADWGTDSLFFYEAGRYPTFLIKASAFKVPFIGKMLYGAGQIPVNRGAADAAQGAQAGRAGAQGRRGGDHLPRGNRHPRPGPVADGGQDRRRPGGPRHRRAGDPRRALGYPRRPPLRQQEAQAVATANRPYGSRQAGRPVGMGRQADLGAGPARRHRRDHGRRDGPGGVAARRGTARRYRSTWPSRTRPAPSIGTDPASS